MTITVVEIQLVIGDHKLLHNRKKRQQFPDILPKSWVSDAKEMKLALKLILIPAECLVLVASDSEWSKLGKQDDRPAGHNFSDQIIFVVVTSIQSKSFRQKHVMTTIESC